MKILLMGSSGYANRDVVFADLEITWGMAGGEVIEVCHVAEGQLKEIIERVVKDNADLGMELTEPTIDVDGATAYLLPDQSEPLLLELLQRRGVPGSTIRV